MARLTIQTERPTLDIVSTRATLNIKTPKRRCRIRTTAPRMEIQRQMPTFKLDWAHVRAQRGLGSPESVRQAELQRATQATSDAIGRIAENGKYASNLENYANRPGTVFGDLAKMNTQHKVPTINVGQGSSPKVEWMEGKLDIEWTEGGAEIEWDEEYMPEITWTPYSVEIKLTNHSRVVIGLEEDKAPKHTGRHINMKV